MFTLIEGLLFRLGPILLSRKRNLFICLSLFSLFTQSLGIGDVIWAVNCGGEGHTDIHGIRYDADQLKIGIASDYGKTLMISRVVPQDNILYQTERYHTSTFGYEVPIKQDGDYVLVLKFCEVWFTSPNQKVSGEFDNPKINALYIMKGSIDDIPKLPPLPGAEPQKEVEEEEEEEDLTTYQNSKKVRKPSGPKVKDPYAADDTSTMLLPVFVAVGAFVPLLFCLCKL
ncbi:hypothetical protein KUTeg_010099 [Tegillarca granosa]|uniref:Malectin domain-containing protein n=1 Tax=Tegillarca granosa TaxID=220873 RepID=A0ABQ9F5T1_TEGGR|nr:hypothetical protein KUTeg_010099 [Tegillarca granosa]